MSETYGEHRSYRFGEFTLDADRGGIFRNDTQVPLRPKSFDVLRYLVERQGKLVGRDELLDAVWAGTVVTDESVTQCMIDIRKALGDGSQTIIRTVPRRGYVFELPVEALGESAAPVPSGGQPKTASLLTGRSVLAVFAIVAAVVVLWSLGGQRGTVPDELPGIDIAADKPSIAVLPFQSMSSEQGRAYFADGVSEEIINTLARQQGLRVIARTSSFSFRGQNLDIGTIAARLDASHVLEGSIRNDGDALRVNVQLVDAGTGTYVWTEQFERELSATTVFAIQTEIATAVVQSLQTELSPEERARLTRVPTGNMSALYAYFEARQLMETRRTVEVDRAVELLEDVINDDPGFALAHVALADALRLASIYGTMSPPEAEERGMRAVRAAIAIDDRLGEAYASLGNLLSGKGDIAGAEDAFLKGIELSPSYAPLYQWYGQFLEVWAGRPLEAVPYLRIATALDPRSAIINTDYASSLASAGRLPEAMAQFEAALEIDPEFAKAHAGIGHLLRSGLGRVADAIPYYETAAVHSPDDPSYLVYLSYAYADLGDFQAAADYIDKTLRMSPLGPHAHLGRLRLSAVQGDTAAATESAELVAESWPGDPTALRYLRDKDVTTGDTAAAVQRYERYYPEFSGQDDVVINGWNFEAAIDLSYLLMTAGRRERASQLLAGSLGYVLDQPSGTIPNNHLIAEVRIHAIRGDIQQALDTLAKAVSDGWRWHWRLELEHDLALAELRERPAYEAILQTIREDMEGQSQATEPGRNPRYYPK